MDNYTFKFKNKTYQLTDKWDETSVNDSKEFQLQQFEYLINSKDYLTVENRIINQEKFEYIKEIL